MSLSTHLNAFAGNLTRLSVTMTTMFEDDGCMYILFIELLAEASSHLVKLQHKSK